MNISTQETPHRRFFVYNRLCALRKKAKECYTEDSNETSMAGSKNILIVEDDQFLIKALRDKLERSGFAVHVATNGEEALRLMSEAKPNLILLDLVMPKMNGFQFLEEFNKLKGKNKAHVVVLSNLGQEEDRDKAQKLGAKDYFVKADMSLKQIVETVEKYLS